MTGTLDHAPALTERQRTKLYSRLAADREETAELIARLRGDLEGFQVSRRDSTPDDESDPEGPTLDFERSQSTAVLQQAEAHLAMIETAVGRLDAGTYGNCAGCGRPIPMARLEVRPYSTHCVGCAEHLGR